MTGKDRQDPPGDDRDGGINAALLKAIRRSEPELVWPNDSAVAACVHGSASDSQRAEVQKAMARSMDFQRYYLDIVADIDFLNSPLGWHSYCEVDVHSCELTAPVKTQREESRDLIANLSDLWMRLLQDLSRGLGSRLLVPATVAIGVLLVVAFWPPTSQNMATASLSYVDRLDESGLTSGGARGELDGFELSASAAHDEIRRRITYDSASSEFSLKLGERVEVPDCCYLIEVKLSDSTGGHTQTLRGFMPRKGSEGTDSEMAIWVVALPSASLWTATIVGKSQRITWDPGDDSIGCVVLTYKMDETFRAVTLHMADPE